MGVIRIIYIIIGGIFLMMHFRLLISSSEIKVSKKSLVKSSMIGWLIAILYISQILTKSL